MLDTVHGDERTKAFHHHGNLVFSSALISVDCVRNVVRVIRGPTAVYRMAWVDVSVIIPETRKKLAPHVLLGNVRTTEQNLATFRENKSHPRRQQYHRPGHWYHFNLASYFANCAAYIVYGDDYSSAFAMNQRVQIASNVLLRGLVGGTSCKLFHALVYNTLTAVWPDGMYVAPYTHVYVYTYTQKSSMINPGSMASEAFCCSTCHANNPSGRLPLRCSLMCMHVRATYSMHACT